MDKIATQSPQKIGLLLTPSHSPSVRSLTKGKDFSIEELSIIITVQNQGLSYNFITNPELRNLLKKTNKKVDERFGKILFKYNKQTKTLTYSIFYPYPIKLVGQALEAVPKKSFVSKGIASLIETRALKMALKQFPQARSVEFFLPSDFLKKRLKKIKIFYTKKTDINKYNKKIRDKLASDLRTARKKRSIKR